MTDRVRVAHDDHLKPGTWCIGAAGEVLHRCPLCKTASNLLNHSIAADGTVNNSMACFAPCSFHIWGTLDGWTHGVKLAGKDLVT